MKILFLSRGRECQRLFEWTLSRNIEVVGAIGCDAGLLSEFGINNVKFDSEEIKKLEPDLIISYVYDKYISRDIFDIPAYGCINFHPAPLPEYRGRGGCNFAILDKCKYFGVTAHYVDESYDTGNIIRVLRFDIDYRQETAKSLKRKTMEHLFYLYKSIVLDVIEKRDRLSSVPQAKGMGRYISYKDMMEGMKIDADKDDIDNKIRAFWYPPYMGAYVEIQGKKYTLVNEEILKKIDD